MPAWEAAVKAVTGRDFQLSSIRIPGLTDFQIALRTFEMLGIEATDETLRRMVCLYEEGLPAALPLKHGRVLPNVREILERLRSCDDVRSYLLTGNTRGGARAKLMHYGLFDYFPDGAFAEDTRDRSTIASRALELARRAGPVAEDRVFVIGDTPHDIHCAHAIGARAIAVATGGYSLDELAAHNPWRVLQELPPPSEFLQLIGIRDRDRIRAGTSDRIRIPTRIPDPDPRSRNHRMRHLIRRIPALWRASRLARRWYHARFDAYPDWREAIASDRSMWDSARATAKGGPRVLMATAIGSYAHAVSLESALAAALTFRGAEVHALLCDGTMTACAECEASLYPNLAKFVQHGPSRDLCRDCPWPAERVYRQLGLTLHRYSDWLTAEDREHARTLASSIPLADVERFTLDGLAIGEHAHAGALRFFATGTLDAEPLAEPVLRRYLEAALLTAYATRRLLRALNFTSAVFTHGIYVPWGIVGEVARQEGVHVSTWNVAYRKRRFIFSHDDSYHHTLMTEPREHWENLELSPAQDRELMQYLSSRREGLFDWIVFHRPKRHDPQQIAARLGLDPAKPVIGLPTSVTWDAQLHYPSNAFPNMLEWLVQTCEYFAHAPGSAAPHPRAPGRDQRVPQVAAAHPPGVAEAAAAAGAQYLRGAAGKRHEHLRADVVVQRRHHLLDEDGRGAHQRGSARHRGGRGVDPQQGTDLRCELPRGVLPAPGAAALPGAARRRAPGACAPVRVSLLLQPHDSAAVHRAEGRLPHLSPQARHTRSTPARTVAGTGYNLRRDSRRDPLRPARQGCQGAGSRAIVGSGLRAPDSGPGIGDSLESPPVHCLPAEAGSHMWLPP